MSRPGELGVFLAVFRLTSEGFVGSNPTAPTKFAQLDNLFGTLIGELGTITGNHRRMFPGVGQGPQGRGSIIFDHEGAPCADSE